MVFLARFFFLCGKINLVSNQLVSCWPSVTNWLPVGNQVVTLRQQWLPIGQPTDNQVVTIWIPTSNYTLNLK